MVKKRNTLGFILGLMSFFLIASCGSDNKPVNPVTISGVAETGTASTGSGKPVLPGSLHQAVAIDTVIANGAVSVFNKLGQILGTGATDTNGAFSLQVPPGLDYFVQVLSQDGETAVRSYLANVNLGSADTIVNAFTSTLVYAMEQRFNTSFANPESGGFAGTESILTGANQIVAAAGFPELVPQVQSALANGNVPNGIPGVQAALTAFLDALPTGNTGGNTGGTGGNTGGTTITVTAGTGLTPAYTFVGGAVNSLSVMRTSAPTTVVWGIVTPGSDGIASPLTHNTVGNGVVQTFSAETTLTAGVEYRVVVTRLDGSTGFTSFTPSAGGTTGGGTGGNIGNTITLTVGTGLTPAYTFDGGAVGAVVVTRTSDPTTEVWSLAIVGDGIASPVTHGTVPPGAFVVSSTETTLTSGIEYRVVVIRSDGSHGSTDFTSQ